MRKHKKLAHMEGAVICFNVATPFSRVGEQHQHVVLLVTGIFRAKTNGEYYIKGISLKRIQHSSDPQFRQYKISEIEDRTIAVIVDNEWTKEHKVWHLQDKRAKIVKYESVSVDLKKLK